MEDIMFTCQLALYMLQYSVLLLKTDEVMIIDIN